MPGHLALARLQALLKAHGLSPGQLRTALAAVEAVVAEAVRLEANSCAKLAEQEPSCLAHFQLRDPCRFAAANLADFRTTLATRIRGRHTPTL